MSKKYPEYESLNLPSIAEKVLKDWEENKIFEKSISSREGKDPFVFYEGPPSANGLPGIHHVMARAMKDIFCRYQTLKGRQVKRKAGWDTHGLPIELSVEKTLGITKEDIGKKISIEDYNKACRTEVMKYTHLWEDVTKKMGYWVDMSDPYITYENKYIESVWWLLQQFYQKELLYKGYSIQPYSPAAGTGLSTHELNQPGCYRNVKDRTATAMFKLIDEGRGKLWLENITKLYPEVNGFPLHFLAWTTTPWTLPSNTALAVGKNIVYTAIQTVSPFNDDKIIVVLALDLFTKYFNVEKDFENLQAGMMRFAVDGKLISGGKINNWRCLGHIEGQGLIGMKYEQLLPYVLPFEDADKAFQVIAGDFVSTSDGTGIVHIAPTFGADDMRAANGAGVPAMLVHNEFMRPVPLVDLRGRFRPEMKEFAGEYVKADYLNDKEKASEIERLKSLSGNPLNELVSKIVTRTNEYLSVDERIVLKLEQEGKLFKKETYEHNYPHCWRTDKPVLYYPLDSWFIKASSMKERMGELNKTINWKPESTGTGRFGEWLNNLQDWNLSRSRYWGIPLPIWRNRANRPKRNEICIGSIADLKLKNAYVITDKLRDPDSGQRMTGVAFRVHHNEFDLINGEARFPLKWKGFIERKEIVPFSEIDSSEIDLHRPFVDHIIFYEEGEVLIREFDLIDVWFDSGAMPYAQLHYPFENKDQIDNRTYFPADFIAEGVDQTRGWFYTLHAIAVILFDSVAYKNVISNGLVLDKNGNKMSKRLGNTVDPFETLKKYGPDATRWYMVTNASPWDNLKFDIEGITEVQRKFFGTLYNTYSFFALYANIDGFIVDAKTYILVKDRPELDRWIISRLHSLIKFVTAKLDDYDPTPAARAIDNFVDEHLSNWYVRLSRRRFWKGEMSTDKQAAYQTLYECLGGVAQLMSPFAPFFGDWLFKSLTAPVSDAMPVPESVHLSLLMKADASAIDSELEERMAIAQKVTSLVHSLRKEKKIRVRQPLERVMIPVLDPLFSERLHKIEHLILAETNVRRIEYVTETGIFVKKVKPDFKALGKKLGKNMKSAADAIAALNAGQVNEFEQRGFIDLTLGTETIRVERSEVEILVDDLPGWEVAVDGAITVALDVTMSAELIEEGLARELINRIQNIRKDSGFEVTDRIDVRIKEHKILAPAVRNNFDYICSETLATSLELVSEISEKNATPIDVDDNVTTVIYISKHN